MGIHVLAWAGRDAPPAMRWYIELDLLARILVPSFIILTGVVLAWSAGADRRPADDFLRKRFVRIGVPWLVWATVWMAVWKFIAPVLSGNEIVPLPQLLEAVASGPGYLSFLVLILQLSVIFPLFPAGPGGRLAVTVAAVLLQMGLSVLRLFLQDLPEPLYWLLIHHAYKFGLFWVGY